MNASLERQAEQYRTIFYHFPFTEIQLHIFYATLDDHKEDDLRVMLAPDIDLRGSIVSK